MVRKYQPHGKIARAGPIGEAIKDREQKDKAAALIGGRQDDAFRSHRFPRQERRQSRRRLQTPHRVRAGWRYERSFRPRRIMGDRKAKAPFAAVEDELALRGVCADRL